VLTFVIGILAIPTKQSDGSSKSMLSNGLGYLSHAIEAGSGNLINQTDGYTAVLIMGIDSRELEFDSHEFRGEDRNVDVIIQAVYDHKNNNIFLISIPRDTGYEIDDSCVNQGFDKAINRLYKIGQDGDCVKGGIRIMLEATEEITGFENHYYSLVSFETFDDVIAQIGELYNGEKGLWIDVPEAVYELYPTDNGFENVSFKKGLQFMNSQDLLIYSRSRKNSSDFVRSRRQQIVIEAIKNRLLSLEILQSPIKLKALYDSFRDNSLYSQLNLKEIVALVGMSQKLGTANIYKMVLDNEFGGTNKLILKPSYSPPYEGHVRPGYYLTPKHYKDECCKVDEYSKIKEYLKSIYNDPAKLEEDYNG
jgi:LCP family protein required for cell wall assembly